jgi:hypothetical protein
VTGVAEMPRCRNAAAGNQLQVLLLGKGDVLDEIVMTSMNIKRLELTSAPPEIRSGCCGAQV